MSYDGQEGVSNPYMVSFAGTISGVVDRANYAVQSDCTGTYTSVEGTRDYDFRVSADGNKIDYIETDAGTVGSGSATRVKD
jgi:hypothetical protein